MRKILLILVLLVVGAAIAGSFNADAKKAMVYGYRVLRATFRLPFAASIPEPEEVSCQLCAEKFAACAADLPHFVIYDSKEVKIDYPNGDFDPGRGVCTDVVVRALRCAGLDLQVKVHEYRKRQGLETNTNLDHRRVRYIGPYMEASSDWKTIPNSGPYEPGDIIWWKTPGGASNDHIGIFVTSEHIVHNQGYGVWADARPDDHKIHRVYRWSR